MAERKYQSQVGSAPQSAAVAPPQRGGVAARDVVGRFGTHVANPQQVLHPNMSLRKGGSDFAQALIGKARSLVDEMVEASRMEAYLQGAAAVGKGIAEEQLETHPLTKAWSVAGHRDYTAMVAAADYASKLQSELGKTREMSPEAYTRYIAEQRRELMPVIDGMSRAERSKMFSNLLTTERSAITKHANEHAKFVVEQKMQALQTGASVVLNSMQMSRDTPEQYQAAVESAYAFMYNNIWDNPDLPTESRIGLVKEMVSAAMQNGDLSFYNMLRDFAPEEGGLPLIHMLPLDEQVKLSKEYHTARNLHIAEQEGMFYEQVYTAFDMLEQGEVIYTPTEMRSMLVDASLRKTISPEKANSLSLQYNRKYYETQASAAMVEAWVSGKWDTMNQSDMSLDKIGKAYEQSLFQAGATSDQVAIKQLTVGMSTGNAIATRRAGELLAPGINKLMSPEVTEYDESVNRLIQASTMMYDQYRREGSNMHMTHFLAGMNDEQSQFMNMYFSMMESGLTKEEALDKTRKRWFDIQQMTPQARALESQRNNEYAKELLSDITSSRWKYNPFPYIGSFFSSVVGSGEYAQMVGIRPVTGGKTSPETVTRYASILQTEALREIDRINQSGVVHTEDSLRRGVLAGLLSRSIDTPLGTMILPSKDALRNALGVAESSYSTDVVTRAIRETYTLLDKPNEAGLKADSTVLEYDNGRIIVSGYLNGQYRPDLSMTIYPDELKAKYDEVTVQLQEEAGNYVGSGVPLQGAYIGLPGKLAGKNLSTPSGTFRVNGVNTAGFDPKQAMEWKLALAQQEGVVNHDYADGGAKSRGVGVHDSMPKEFHPVAGKDGKYSLEAIQASFDKTADYFMNAAKKRMITRTKDDGAYAELLFNVLYQAGETNFDRNNSSYQRMQAAIIAGDKEAAIAAFKETPAYKQSGNERRRYRLKLLNKLF